MERVLAFGCHPDDVEFQCAGTLALLAERGYEVHIATMGGGELFDHLKRIDNNVSVILSSGYSLDGQASEIISRGCNGFIQKPFNINELSEKIHQILQPDACRIQ